MGLRIICIMKPAVAFITGGTSGIGFAAASALAQIGLHVVITGRDPHKCEIATRKIQRLYGDQSISYLTADLSSLTDIRSLAERFDNIYGSLSILINNAATIAWSRQQSQDGIEMTFAVNHIGHFLLTNLLLPKLMNSQPSRIINVSSAAHVGARINVDEIHNPTTYQPWEAYKQSKMANILFTYSLSEKLKDTAVTVNAVHPGLVATNLPSNGKIPIPWISKPLLRLILSIIGRDPKKSGLEIAYLATSSHFLKCTGLYFVDGTSVRPDEMSRDKNLAKQLWDLSSRITESHSNNKPL